MQVAQNKPGAEPEGLGHLKVLKHHDIIFSETPLGFMSGTELRNDRLLQTCQTWMRQECTGS